jgi:hypothetical protein
VHHSEGPFVLIDQIVDGFFFHSGHAPFYSIIRQQ